MAILYVQSPTLYLSGAGVVIGATSVTLTSLTDIYGNVLTMSDFGALGYLTLEPDTNNAEGATFTGVTANANGTYTLTGVKTVLAKSPYTQTSGLVRNHSGGTKVVVTDNVAFWNTFTNKENNETINGVWTFPGATLSRVSVASDADVTTVTNLVTYGQLQRTAIAGGTPGSTLVIGYVRVSVDPVSAASPISVGDNDGRVPTQGENDALVGTAGTPSSSNKYVTNQDTGATAVIGAVARRNATGDVTVNTTPTASTDAASKAYVDAGGTNTLTVFNAPPMGARSVGTATFATNTSLILGAYLIPGKIVVNKVSIYASAGSGSSTVTISCYSADGQTRHFSVTTAAIAAGGLVTTAVSAVTLNPGMYWIGVNTNGAASVGLETDVATNLGVVTSEPTTMATLTITASTAPATITPGAFNGAGNPPQVRLDN